MYKLFILLIISHSCTYLLIVNSWIVSFTLIIISIDMLTLHVAIVNIAYPNIVLTFLFMALMLHKMEDFSQFYFHKVASESYYKILKLWEICNFIFTNVSIFMEFAELLSRK